MYSTRSVAGHGCGKRVVPAHSNRSPNKALLNPRPSLALPHKQHDPSLVHDVHAPSPSDR